MIPKYQQVKGLVAVAASMLMAVNMVGCLPKPMWNWDTIQRFDNPSDPLYSYPSSSGVVDFRDHPYYTLLASQNDDAFQPRHDATTGTHPSVVSQRLEEPRPVSDPLHVHVGKSPHRDVQLPMQDADPRYGTLKDLIGNSVQQRTVSSDGFAQTRQQAPTSLEHEGIVTGGIPVTQIEPAAATSLGQEQGSIFREHFPGNVNGIIITDRPGFLRSGTRSNKYQNADTVEWQRFINEAYFGNTLEWLPTAHSQLEALRLSQGKARTHYILPAVIEEMPSIRLHRHAIRSRFLTAYKPRLSLSPTSTVISVWSDPILQPKEEAPSKSLVREHYVTVFFGLAEVKGPRQLRAIEALEKVISTHPPATYIRFS